MGHDLLLTNTKIASINPTFNSLCPRCNVAEETLVHALRDCEKARNTLMKGGIDDRVLNLMWTNGIDWLENFMRIMDNIADGCFIAILWNLWNSRNNFIFRGQDEEPKVIWEWVVNFSNELRLHDLHNVAMLPKHVKDSK